MVQSTSNTPTCLAKMADEASVALVTNPLRYILCKSKIYLNKMGFISAGHTFTGMLYGTLSTFRKVSCILIAIFWQILHRDWPCLIYQDWLHHAHFKTRTGALTFQRWLKDGLGIFYKNPRGKLQRLQLIGTTVFIANDKISSVHEVSICMKNITRLRGLCLSLTTSQNH